MIQYETCRSKQERDAIALSDFAALVTSIKWKESDEDVSALDAHKLVAKSPACLILPKIRKQNSS